MLIKIEFNDENKNDKDYLEKVISVLLNNDKRNNDGTCTADELTTESVNNSIVIPAVQIPSIQTPKLDTNISGVDLNSVSLPTQNTEIKYTRNQLAEAMAKAVNNKGAAVIKEILTSFGYQTLVEVPEEKYTDLANLLISKGVEI